MTAINLGLYGLRGWAVWQNTLTLEVFRVYKIGFNLHGGVIKEVPVAESPFNYAAQKKQPNIETKPPEPPPPTTQLDLF